VLPALAIGCALLVAGLLFRRRLTFTAPATVDPTSEAAPLALEPPPPALSPEVAVALRSVVLVGCAILLRRHRL
jgi:hypothetical protein